MDKFFSQFTGPDGCFNKDGGCGWNEVAFLFNDILKALIYIGLFAAACMVAYAGYLMVKGRGEPGALKKARKIFMNIVLGLILLLGAYFIVDLFLTQLGVKDEFREGFVEPGSSSQTTQP